MIFSFWWALVSFLIYRLLHILKDRNTIIATIILAFLFFTILVVDNYFRIPDNPVTISLVVVFWILILYILDPIFFKKYKRIIIGVYGTLLAYFIYVRIFTDYFHEEHSTLFSFTLFTFPVIILLWFFEQWKRIERLKQEKSAAELELLKSQINPHFFFNTLNNLYGLAIEKSDESPRIDESNYFTKVKLEIRLRTGIVEDSDRH